MRFASICCCAATLAAQIPAPISNSGYDLPNGWKLSPAGKQIRTEDMALGSSRRG
jgi:hypothetical protein